jgi:hypothetical protein
MQEVKSSSSPSRFGLLLLGAVVAITACWFGLNYFDKTLGKARRYLVEDQGVIASIGNVSSTTLYKVRYFDARDSSESCFAEYFMYASGENSKSLDLRVVACGLRESPTFKVSRR